MEEAQIQMGGCLVRKQEKKKEEGKWTEARAIGEVEGRTGGMGQDHMAREAIGEIKLVMGLGFLFYKPRCFPAEFSSMARPVVGAE